jgi:biotin-(acetyl-CoA carboxylase) ligase
VQQLEIALNSNNTSALVEAWRCRSTLLGHDIALSTNGETLIGHVIDLDPTQGLILRTHDGIIHHLPAATTTIIP